MVGVISKQVGDLRLEFGSDSVSTILQSKARQVRLLGVRKVKPYAGGISEADKDAAYRDTDWEQPHFRVGQHDHPGLGINTTSTRR